MRWTWIKLRNFLIALTAFNAFLIQLHVQADPAAAAQSEILEEQAEETAQKYFDAAKDAVEETFDLTNPKHLLIENHHGGQDNIHSIHTNDAKNIIFTLDAEHNVTVHDFNDGMHKVIAPKKHQSPHFILKDIKGLDGAVVLNLDKASRAIPRKDGITTKVFAFKDGTQVAYEYRQSGTTATRYIINPAGQIETDTVHIGEFGKGYLNGKKPGFKVSPIWNWQDLVTTPTPGAFNPNLFSNYNNARKPVITPLPPKVIVPATPIVQPQSTMADKPMYDRPIGPQPETPIPATKTPSPRRIIPIELTDKEKADAWFRDIRNPQKTPAPGRSTMADKPVWQGPQPETPIPSTKTPSPKRLATTAQPTAAITTLDRTNTENLVDYLGKLQMSSSSELEATGFKPTPGKEVVAFKSHEQTLVYEFTYDNSNATRYRYDGKTWYKRDEVFGKDVRNQLSHLVGKGDSYLHWGFNIIGRAWSGATDPQISTNRDVPLNPRTNIESIDVRNGWPVTQPRSRMSDKPAETNTPTTRARSLIPPMSKALVPVPTEQPRSYTKQNPNMKSYPQPQSKMADKPYDRPIGPEPQTTTPILDWWDRLWTPTPAAPSTKKIVPAFPTTSKPQSTPSSATAGPLVVLDTISQTPLSKTDFAILGLEPNSTPDQIEAKLRLLMRQNHPTRQNHGDAELMRQLNEIRSKLKAGANSNSNTTLALPRPKPSTTSSSVPMSSALVPVPTEQPRSYTKQNPNMKSYPQPQSTMADEPYNRPIGPEPQITTPILDWWDRLWTPTPTAPSTKKIVPAFPTTSKPQSTPSSATAGPLVVLDTISQTPLSKTDFAILGLEPNSTPDQIEAKLRLLMRQNHPTRQNHGDAELMRQLNEIRSKLKAGANSNSNTTLALPRPKPSTTSSPVPMSSALVPVPTEQPRSYTKQNPNMKSYPQPQSKMADKPYDRPIGPEPQTTTPILDWWDRLWTPTPTAPSTKKIVPAFPTTSKPQSTPSSATAGPLVVLDTISQTPLSKTDFAILGLEPNSTPDQIEAKLRLLMRQNHPTRQNHGDAELMRQLNEIRSKLKAGANSNSNTTLALPRPKPSTTSSPVPMSSALVPVPTEQPRSYPKQNPNMKSYPQPQSTMADEPYNRPIGPEPKTTTPILDWWDRLWTPTPAAPSTKKIVPAFPTTSKPQSTPSSATAGPLVVLDTISQTPLSKTDFAILGLEPNSTPDQIEAKLRLLMRQNHPTRQNHGDAELMRQLNEIRSKLKAGANSNSNTTLALPRPKPSTTSSPVPMSSALVPVPTEQPRSYPKQNPNMKSYPQPQSTIPATKTTSPKRSTATAPKAQPFIDRLKSLFARGAAIIAGRKSTELDAVDEENSR